MELSVILLTVTMLLGVEAGKKCPKNSCDNVYKPVCGHDRKLGYLTFCSAEELANCNEDKGFNFRQIATGPCYPSVRHWKTQSTFPKEDLQLRPQQEFAARQGAGQTSSRPIRSLRGFG